MPNIATAKLGDSITRQKKILKANEKDAVKQKVNLGRADVITQDVFGPQRHECKTNYYGGYVIIRVEATSKTYNAGGGTRELGRAETKAKETARLKAMEAAEKPVGKNCPNPCKKKSDEKLEVDRAVTLSKRIDIVATGTKKNKGKNKYKATVLASCDWKYKVSCPIPKENKKEKNKAPKKNS